MEELKKIWRPGILLILCIISSLYYFLFMDFEITHFPNGHPNTEIFNLSVEWTEKYGLSMDESERKDAEKQFDVLYAEAERWISALEIFRQAGIYSYKEYRRMYEMDEKSELQSDAEWTLLGEECKYVEFRIQALENLLENYDHRAKEYQEQKIADATGQPEKKSLEQHDTEQRYQSIMPYVVIESFSAYSSWTIVWLLLSVCILLSPLMVRDRMTRVNEHQVSSRIGRKVYWKQFGAVMLSAIALITIELFAAIAIYATNNTQALWHNGMNSFMGYTFLREFTYGGYVMTTIAMAYVFSMSAVLIFFLLSKFSANYVSLILKLIPAFILLSILAQMVIAYSFSSINFMYQKTSITAIEPVICSALLIAGLFSCIVAGKREKRKELA